ncbi:uncharacterized protein LOC113347074 [Papaver somniferum]|uniref:uncharacterized protein LOC113347074 n=1 Tax=Papaver somniferum TaxID=3469 RepID=UPI000E6FF368|nr:uncharacterized protein LOC113347074 [Papaver somniferum]
MSGWKWSLAGSRSSFASINEPSWFEALLGYQSPWTAHQDCWIFKVIGSKCWPLISRYKASASEETHICVAHLHDSSAQQQEISSFMFDMNTWRRKGMNNSRASAFSVKVACDI